MGLFYYLLLKAFLNDRALEKGDQAEHCKLVYSSVKTWEAEDVNRRLANLSTNKNVTSFQYLQAVRLRGSQVMLKM